MFVCVCSCVLMCVYKVKYHKLTLDPEINLNSKEAAK